MPTESTLDMIEKNKGGAGQQNGQERKEFK